MSIAIHTRPAAAARANRAASVKRAALSPEEQLQETRALLRHFMLAFTGAAAAIYVVVAAGLAL